MNEQPRERQSNISPESHELLEAKYQAAQERFEHPQNREQHADQVAQIARVGKQPKSAESTPNLETDSGLEPHFVAKLGSKTNLTEKLTELISTSGKVGGVKLHPYEQNLIVENREENKQ